MTPRTVRRVVIAVCVLGIAGMIVTSIADNNGAALTTGLATAVAVLCLIVATAVSHGSSVLATTPPGDHEAAGAALEGQIQALVDQGADEARLRSLVGEAVRFGQARV